MPVNNISLTGPTDYALEQAKVMRQQKLADALREQSMQVSGTEYAPGGYAVKQSPLQGISKLAQAFASSQIQKRSDDRLTELATKQRGDQSADMSSIMAALQGTPASTSPQQGPTQDGQPLPDINIPAQPGNLSNLDPSSLRTPEARQMIAQMMMQQAVKGSEPYTLAPGAQRYGPGNTPVASAPFKPDAPAAIGSGGLRMPDGTIVPPSPAPKEATPLPAGHTRTVREGEQQVTQELQGDGSWKEIGRGPAFAKSVAPTFVQPAPVTAVTVQDPENPNATIVIDGRTGKQLGKGPKLSETGRSNYKQQAGMQGLGGDLQSAEDLLLGNVRDSEGNVTKGNLPTGSGIGSMYDSVAGLVGASPAGAAEADALKTVAARLVSKVPRMEGPQSDKDVVLYKQAAGDAGNDKLPRERRLAAVRKMKEIYVGYEDGTRGRLLQDQINNPPGARSSGGTGALSPAEQQELDALRAKHGRRP